jgi:hypothetical protein
MNEIGAEHLGMFPRQCVDYSGCYETVSKSTKIVDIKIELLIIVLFNSTDEKYFSYQTIITF